MTHICVSKLAIIGLHYLLSPGRRLAIIWTNAEILLIRPLGINFSEIVIGIELFSFTKMHLKLSFVKWPPLCLGLNVLIRQRQSNSYIYKCHFIRSLALCVLPSTCWGCIKRVSIFFRGNTFLFKLTIGLYFNEISKWSSDKTSPLVKAMVRPLVSDTP